MKLEEKNLIVKRSYKEVYKCEEGIVKVFAKEHPKSDVLNEALNTARVEEAGYPECKRSDTDRWKMGSGDRVQRW